MPHLGTGYLPKRVHQWDATTIMTAMEMAVIKNILTTMMMAEASTATNRYQKHFKQATAATKVENSVT